MNEKEKMNDCIRVGQQQERERILKLIDKRVIEMCCMDSPLSEGVKKILRMEYRELKKEVEKK